MIYRLSQTPGVAGDGVTDDRGALQTLLESVPSGATIAFDVQRVLVGPGGLKPPVPVAIQGRGCMVLWQPAPDAVYERLFTLSAPGWTTINNLRVTGPGGTSEHQHAFIISGSSAEAEVWVSMVGCSTLATPGDGLLLHSHGYLQARECDFAMCGRSGISFSGVYHKADIIDCTGDSISQEAEEGTRLYIRGGRFDSVQTRTHKPGSELYATGVESRTGWMHQGPYPALIKGSTMGFGGDCANGMAGALHTHQPGALSVHACKLSGSVRISWGSVDRLPGRVALSDCTHHLREPVPSSRFYPRAHLSMSQGTPADVVTLKDHTWISDDEQYPLVGTYGVTLSTPGIDPGRVVAR